MKDVEAQERGWLEELAGLSMSGLIDEWEEPMPGRRRELLRAELEARGYRSASLVMPQFAPAERPPPREPRAPRSSAADHPGVLELTTRESLQSVLIAAVVATAGIWALLAFDLGGSGWLGAIGGAVGASFVCTRVARVKVVASADELIEAAKRMYAEASVVEREGPCIVLRVRARSALVAGQLRLQQVDERASIVVGPKIALDRLVREATT